MEYVHYGHSKFIKELFTPISNRAFWLKPIGGLWGSMPDSEFSWKAWCLEENFHTEKLNECFYFSLKPGSRVLSIRKSSDLVPLPKLHESEQLQGTVFLDFEKLAEQYDAIELFVYGDFDLQGLWIINFWTDKKALSANYLSLQLDMMDISNLLNYLHHVQSQTDEKYEPVTGDGLTERQLFEALEKSIADSKTSKCFTPEEVMESLRKQIEEYKENNPIAKLTLDLSKVEKTMTISQSTFKVLSYPEKFDVLFNKERKQLCVIDDKSLSSDTKDARTPFTAPHGDFSCESNMFLNKLLQYVPNLENGKIYSITGIYRADINGLIFPLSDYQLIEECSQ